MQAHDAVRNLRRDLRVVMHKYPESKAKAKEATNSDVWGPTDAQKLELVELACGHSENRTLIFKALWKRVHDDSGYWMHVTKALAVLEYFLIYDVPDILPQIAQNRSRLEQLAASYDAAQDADPIKRNAINENVRSKAARLVRLTDHPELVVDEALKLKLTAARMSGKEVPPAAFDAIAKPATPAADREVPVASTRVSGPGLFSTPHTTPPVQTPQHATPPPAPAPATRSMSASATIPTVSAPVTAPTNKPLFEQNFNVNSTPHFATQSPPAIQPQHSQAQFTPESFSTQSAAAHARPAAAPAFDPFAAINEAMSGAPTAQRQPAQQRSTMDDVFFDAPAPTRSTYAAPMSFVPQPAVPLVSGAATAPAPAPRRSPAPDAAMEAMLQQLQGYEGKAPRQSQGNNESLQARMARGH